MTISWQKMRAAAEKAIQLDPLLAEAHDARAVAYARDGKWVEAEKGFQEAILIDTNRSMTHADFAIELLLVLGRTGEALRQLLVAEKTRPAIARTSVLRGLRAHSGAALR